MCFQGYPMAEYQHLYLRPTCPPGQQGEEEGKTGCTSLWLELPSSLLEYTWVVLVCTLKIIRDQFEINIYAVKSITFGRFGLIHDLVANKCWFFVFVFNRRTELCRVTNKDIRNVLRKFHPDQIKPLQKTQTHPSSQSLLVSNLYWQLMILEITKLWN